MHTVTVNVSGVAPWWPRTLGSAALYNVTVTLITNISGDYGAQEIDTHALRIGFRVLKQVRLFDAAFCRALNVLPPLSLVFRASSLLHQLRMGRRDRYCDMLSMESACG